MPTRPAAATRRSRARVTPTSSRRRAARSRERARARGTRGKALRGLAIGGAIAAVVLIAGVVVAAALAAHALGEFTEDRGTGQPFTLPPPPPGVAGYDLEQLDHACTIMTAGRDLGLGERDQTIAVMTAMGESSLRNLTYGDWETSGVTNPDGSPTTSIGLFQQQDGWGTRDARLDPYTAAGMFYRAMTLRVPERASVEPTLIAHRTQVNADPNHYARYWEQAVRVVAALNDHPLARDRAADVPNCPAA